jgi:hypothetical protein
MGLCYPHLTLGTTECDYKVALMVLHCKNSLTVKELKSRICSYEAEELESNEMDDDRFSIRSDITDVGDNDITFSDDAITPCALNYKENGRSHLTRLDKQTKSFLSPQTVNWVSDGIDRCRIGFLPKAYVPHAKMWDGALCQVVYVGAADDPSSIFCQKFHHCCGYARVLVISALGGDIKGFHDKYKAMMD